METGRMNLRDVPLHVIDHYKARAAQAGQSMSAYVVERLTEAAERKPTQEELLASIVDPTLPREELDAFDAAVNRMRDDWTFD